VEWREGKLRLAAPGYAPAAVHKNRLLPGSIADFTLTPFAVVIGTSSKDPEMVALCQQKAKAFVDGWREWQKQEPRVFKDTEIEQADMARYSLLLVGGAEANRVTARLAAKVPLRIWKDRITIDGKAFAVQGAAVQMIYPNPLNAERYVWIAAGTSTDGMFFWESNPQVRYDWEYMITDGHMPAHKQPASPLQTGVVSGMFDHDWRFSDSLAQPGDAEIRAKGRLRHRPNAKLVIDPKLVESYLGRYQIAQGPLVEVTKDGERLLAKQQGESDAMELVPETETSFCIPRYNLWISFTRDASGKVTGLIGYQNGDFEGRKLD
jgi:hypothetical protein